jgi:hypothetical protein
MFETERHQHAGNEPERHDQQEVERLGEHVRQRRVKHDAVKMMDRERLGAQCRDHRRRRDRADIAETAPPCRAAVEQTSQTGAPLFIGGDQRHDGAKGHLKADPDQAFGVDEKNQHRGERADPHRDSQPVDQHGGEHDAVHDE